MPICTYVDCPRKGESFPAWKVRTYNHYGCDVCSRYWDDFASEDSKCHEPGHTIKKDTFQRNVCPYCDNAE